MRKIFVAAFAFAGFILTPAIASARPPARTYQVAPTLHPNVERTAAIKQRVERTLRRASQDLNQGQRQRLVTPREATRLRAQIRGVRSELRQSLRFDGTIRPREASRLEASVRSLEVSVADALRPNHRFAGGWNGGWR